MIGGDHVCVSVHPIFYFCFASSTDHFDFLSLVASKNQMRALHFFNHIQSRAKDAITSNFLGQN